MKLLALSDLHGDYSYVDELLRKAGDVDAVLIVGDITNFGPDEHAVDLLKKFKQPVLAIPGNCDYPTLTKLLEQYAINLHENSYTMKELTFVGLGGSNPTPFNTPFELSENEIAQKIEKLSKNLKGRGILLSHAPPKNTMDGVGGRNVGSEALTKFLGAFELVVCGHIHEARGSIRINNTLVVNPGKASDGKAALITINHEISVRFIDA